MAEPIGIASGIVALTCFAFQSSVTLFQLVESFHNNQRQVRELKYELEALQHVLESLKSTIAAEDIDLSILNLPLLRCGQACQEFYELVRECTSHSEQHKNSVRDWLKLKYLGSDVTEFKNMLSGYKSTITIALGNVNLNKCRITANALQEYQDLVMNTTCDLREHLQAIEERIAAITQQRRGTSGKGSFDREKLLREKESTQQCLDICSQVSQFANRRGLVSYEDVSTVGGSTDVRVETVKDEGSAKRFTANVLDDVQFKLASASLDLEQRMSTINTRLESIPSYPSHTDPLIDLAKVRAHQETLTRCISICAEASKGADKARTNVFEDVTASQESHQLIISTVGDLISARRVTAEPQATQWLGQMSDASFQQLTQSSRSSTDRVHSERQHENRIVVC